VKVVILAGGLGTRLSEETHLRPKPMVEIGGKPILWHILKFYSSFGLTDFVICCGYKGYVIKEYFANYSLHLSNVTFDFRNGQTEVHHREVEPWKVTLVDTGELTQTGGRLLRVREFLGDEDFCFTYGDGLTDLDVAAEISFHKNHGRLATVCAARPPSRFGALEILESHVTDFLEKPTDSSAWVSGGFFVLSPRVLELIDGDQTAWERSPLEALARSDNLRAFKHHGFWQPMDTLRDKGTLENLWQSGRAPWKRW
jgi:glucose-1-phosphate cytidylyltransferase